MKRRNFMQALGLGALAGAGGLLPKLESAGANPGQIPTRVIIFFSANGTVLERWRPERVGNNWRFKDNDILAPLNGHRDDLIVLEGIDNEAGRRSPGDGHMTGFGCMLTGRELLPGDNSGGCNSCPGAGLASGPSVDQFIAQQLGQVTPYNSLTFGVQPGGPNIWSRMSYSRSNTPVDPIQNPSSAFDNIFGNFVDTAAQEAERRRDRQSSVLDFISQDLRDMRGRVSSTDYDRVNNHLEAVRELEMRLMTGDGEGNACMVPNKGQPFDHTTPGNFPATGRAMMDLIVNSMACDLTRVASIQWSRSVSGVRHTWANVDENHHSLSHEDHNRADIQNKLVNINRWYAEQFAYLLDRLKNTQEVDGSSMLDHTVVLWCNELNYGNRHNRDNVPLVMAGGGGGFFRTGQYLNLDRPMNDVLTSMCHAMGVHQGQNFGDSRYVSGPLTEIHS